MLEKNKRLLLPLVAVLTLGLAPYKPEPHLWGKLKWLFGGAEGMQAMDYFDLFLHAGPWFWLFVMIIHRFKSHGN